MRLAPRWAVPFTREGSALRAPRWLPGATGKEKQWTQNGPGRLSPPPGIARVDEAIAGLSDLDQIDLDERPAVLEEVHDRLREILGELGDAGRQAQAAPPRRPSPAARASTAARRAGQPARPDPGRR